MGKDGEHAEFNMDHQVQRFGNASRKEEAGAAGLGIGGAGGSSTGSNPDFNSLLKKKMKYIVKL